MSSKLGKFCTQESVILLPAVDKLFTYPSEGNAHVTTSTANVDDLAAADLFPRETLLEVFEMSFNYTS